MGERVCLELSKDGWTGGLQLSIQAYEEDTDFGDGYRIYGPKFNGSGRQIFSHQIDKRDAVEIRAYLDRSGF